jgi:hypothetical protein
MRKLRGICATRMRSTNAEKTKKDNKQPKACVRAHLDEAPVPPAKEGEPGETGNRTDSLSAGFFGKRAGLSVGSSLSKS